MLSFRSESSRMTPRVRIVPNRVSLALRAGARGAVHDEVIPQQIKVCSTLPLLRTGRSSRVQQLVWLAVLTGPLACSIYDAGLDEPLDAGVKEGSSGTGGRGGSTTGRGGASASDASGAGGETGGGGGSIEEDGGELDSAGVGGAGGATQRDGSADAFVDTVNRGESGGRAGAAGSPGDSSVLDTRVADGSGGAADVSAEDSGGFPDVSIDVGTAPEDVLLDLNQGIDADPDRRGATPDGGPVVGIVYNIVAQHSGKCMTVIGNLPFDGTNVAQWICDGTTSQQFRLQAVTTSSYVIVHPASNKCINVDKSGVIDETNITLYSCNNTAAQLYALKLTTSPGFFTIVNPNSGKCVDVDGAHMADLANIQIFTCNGGLNQAWEFIDATREQ